MAYTNEPFDPWDETIRPDPHPMYRDVREQAPVYRDLGPVTGRSFWFLARYDDVSQALRDPRMGREVGKLPEAVQGQHEFEGGDAFEMVNRHMLNYDPAGSHPPTSPGVFHLHTEAHSRTTTPH